MLGAEYFSENATPKRKRSGGHIKTWGVVLSGKQANET